MHINTNPSEVCSVKLWEFGRFPCSFRCRSVWIRKLVAVRVVALDTSGPIATNCGYVLVLRPGRKDRPDCPPPHAVCCATTASSRACLVWGFPRLVFLTAELSSLGTPPTLDLTVCMWRSNRWLNEGRTEKQRKEKRWHVSATEQATSTCTPATSWNLLEKELPVVITLRLPTRFQFPRLSVCIIVTMCSEVGRGREGGRERERSGSDGLQSVARDSLEANWLEGPHWTKDMGVRTYLQLRLSSALDLHQNAQTH